MTTIHEISELMTDLEAAALQSFQTTAEAFDLFNNGAASCMRSLLQDNQKLREALDAAGIPDPTADTPAIILPPFAAGHTTRETNPDDPIGIGGTD